MSDTIRCTPLLGGKEDGGVCSLLEIGDARILLDCGCTTTTGNDELLEIASKLREGGGVDCVLLSHADIHHIGALPIIFGSGGLKPVPIVCTLPVAKFTMLALYDLQLNIAMEGTPNNSNAMDNVIDRKRPTFTLDDVDMCLKHVTSTKYSELIPINILSSELELSNKQVTFTAYNAGRTIGGACWDIRHCATCVLYAIDVNLKKEIVLNGAALDALPLSPELLILEGGCANRKALKSNKRLKSGSSERKVATGADDGELSLLVDETLRNKGSVLIPCESASRVYEAIQILTKHWIGNKSAFEHIVFLSPMSYNLIELIQCQLEWMTDSICTKFYNGAPNPFNIPSLKIATSIRELEKLYPGPKVVLSTDISLQAGCAKELLLRWGGNPLNRIIFLDTPDKGTLGQAILDKSTSSSAIVLNVSQPLRVELIGDERAAFIASLEEKRRLREEEATKRIRENELAALSASEVVNDDDEDDDDNASAAAVTNDGDSALGTPRGKLGRSSSDMDVDGNVIPNSTGTNKKRSGKGQASRVAKFAQPLYPLFETLNTVLPSDEYGLAIYDLQLRLDDAPQGTSSVAAITSAASSLSSNNTISNNKNMKSGADQDDDAELIEENILPFKIMATKIKVQFTCDVKSLSIGHSLNGRADLRAIKAIIMKIQPVRVMALRGISSDCTTVQSSVANIGVLTPDNTYAPANGETIEFSVRTDRVNLVIPPNKLLSTTEKRLNDTNNIITNGITNSIELSSINGTAIEITRSTRGSDAGIRRILLKTTLADTINNDDKSKTLSIDPTTGGTIEGDEEENDEETGDIYGFSNITEEGLCSHPLPSSEDNVAVSMGEVSFNSLVSALQSVGINVESMTGTSSDGTTVGTILICDNQIMISRSGQNDFMIEGPPVAAYWTVRKVVYGQFAFLNC